MNTTHNTRTAIWTVGRTTEQHPILGTLARDAVIDETGRQIGTTPAGCAIDHCALGLISGSIRSAQYTTDGNIEVVLDTKVYG